MTGRDEHPLATHVRTLWQELAPRYEVIGSFGMGTLGDIEDELRLVFVAAHGPAQAVTVELPPELVELYRLVDRSVLLRQPDGVDEVIYGRTSFGGLDEFDEELDGQEEAYQDRLAGIRRHGLWHPLGHAMDARELWICVDRGSAHWREVIWTKDTSPHRDAALPATTTHASLPAYLQAVADRLRKNGS